LPADAPAEEILTLQRQGLSRASRARQIRLSPNWCLSDPHFFQQSAIVVQVATWKTHVLFCVLIHGLHLGQLNEKKTWLLLIPFRIRSRICAALYWVRTFPIPTVWSTNREEAADD